MSQSTPHLGPLATPVLSRDQALAQHADRCRQDVGQLVQDFLDRPVHPTALYRFEQALLALLRRFGRTTLEWAMNQLELDGPLASATGWARKMCHWLRDKRHGGFRVLHSAAALRCRSRRRWTRAEKKAYRDGHRYLRKRKPFMADAAYRRQGLLIGSGVTEAACKTVFTQRLKQSGMTWDIDRGQVIVDLRTIWLSRVWDEVHAAYLAGKPLPELGTPRGRRPKTVQNAA
jgi:hypothetical protein